MTVIIRSMQPTEYGLLEDFLYEAIFIPEGVDPPAREIIYTPELKCFFEKFGTSPHDYAVVAEVDGQVVGCAWARIGVTYGQIDDVTPALSISCYPDFRGQGLGTKMLQELLSQLKQAGYAQASLGVQQDNPAVRLYQRLGFTILREEGPEFIMVRQLNPRA